MPPITPNSLTKKFTFAPKRANPTTATESIAANNRRRRTRQGLLAGVITALGGIAILFMYNDDNVPFQLSVESATIGANNTVEIEGLVYTGRTHDGQSFTLASEQVYENAQNPDRIIMQAPTGRINSAEHGIITIKANQGEFLRNNNTARLMGSVVFEQQGLGYTLHSEEIFADLNGGIIESQKPIYGLSQTSTIHADGIIISQADNDVTFLGKTRLVIAGQ